MEEEVWQKEQTPVYGEVYFRAWHTAHKEGFFVAEEEGVLVGLAYSQAMQLSSPPRLQNGATYDGITDSGKSTASHIPTGNYHFGLTLCSQSKGAGAALIKHTLQWSKEKGRPVLGVARIAGFDDYLSSLKRDGIVGNSVSEAVEDEIALHYAIACVRMSKKERQPIEEGSCAGSPYPLPTHPDPILRSYLWHPAFTFYQLLPRFWQDPKCRGYSVLFGQVF